MSVIPLLILTAELDRCELVRQAIGPEAAWQVVGAGPQLIHIYPLGRDALIPEVVMVDLAHPEAGSPEFWINLHSICRRAGMVGVMETAAPEDVWLAALHAGVNCYARWTDPPALLCAAIRHAWEGYAFYTDPHLLVEVGHLLDRRQAHLFQIGPLQLNLAANQATLAGRAVSLTPLECLVLVYLAQNAGRVVPAEELLRQVWKYPAYGTAAQVKNCISRLRRKIEPDVLTPQYIVTVGRSGYQFPHPGQLEMISPNFTRRLQD